MLADYSKDMPSLCNINLRTFLLYGFYYLTDNFLHRHHPKEIFTLCHSCVDKSGADVCNIDNILAFIGFYTQGLHVIDLIGF